MIKAFVGHSFETGDSQSVEAFKKLFNSFKKSMPFDWEDAEGRQLNPLSEKVKQKMEGKNLFIGIFTKKHIEIDPEKILRSWLWNKDKYVVRKVDCVHGTSYWIFQESGYAISKGMRTLFLIEKGVRELKGLHADMEHIYFERGREAECFSELNEALGVFLNEIKGGIEKPKTEKPPIEPKKEMSESISGDSVKVNEQADLEVTGAKKEKEIEKDDKYYFKEIYIALLKKDETRVNKLKEEIYEKFKEDENATVEWRGQILHLESLLAQKNIFNDLRELQNKKPSNSMIAYYMAYEFEKYENYDDAAKEYLKSAQYSSSRLTRLLRTGSASIAHAKSNKKEDALNILLNEIKDNFSEHEKYLIYKYLADTAKYLKDDNLFTSFSEKALLLNPSDDSLRFNLAYKYSEMDKHGLALYHYKILVNNNPEPANLNNLGVVFATLDMPAKAVKFYKEASQIGSTISRANLAQKLLNEGFIDEANEQLTKAVESKDYEKDNVGRALARIDSIQENEVKVEGKALKNIEEERQFKLEYADAYSMPFIINETLDGIWATKHGKIDINLESGNILKGEMTESIPEGGFLGSLIAGALATGSPFGNLPERKTSYAKRIMNFQGHIVKNRIIEYTIKIETHPSNESLLNSATVSEFSGYGIVNSTMNRIRALEIDKDKKQNIYQFSKS